MSTPVHLCLEDEKGLPVMETIQLRYEVITWLYTEGNIIFRDSWNQFS